MLQNNNVLLKSVIMGDFFENECIYTCKRW